MRKRKKNVVYNLLNASKSAMFSAMEIHNKPQFIYRYPTVSMLFINAWELLLKAYIYKNISNKAIYEKTEDGSLHTITFSKALELVKNDINAKISNSGFKAYSENLKLINFYRNSNVHYFEEELNPAIFMLLSKSILNYNDFLKKYFKTDLSEENNLILLPIGFNVPFFPVEFLNKDYHDSNNDFVSEIIKSIKILNDTGIEDSIIVGFDTLLASVKKVTNADIVAAIDNAQEKAIPVTKAYRLSSDNSAIPIKIENLPEGCLDYKSYRKKLKTLIPNLIYNNQFNKINKRIKADKTLCIVNYLDPIRKIGGSKTYYTNDAIKKFIEFYKEQNIE